MMLKYFMLSIHNKAITDEEHPVKSVSVAKLDEMKHRLQSGYTSFWS